MTTWIICSNENKFRLTEYFKKNEFIDWRQIYNFNLNDIVYIYSAIPNRRILFKVQVVRINIPTSETLDDSEYWIDQKEQNKEKKHDKYVRFKLLAVAPRESKLDLDSLKAHGLAAAPQKAKKLDAEDYELLKYLQEQFPNNPSNEPQPFIDDDPTEISNPGNGIFEGAMTRVLVNRYERDQNARNICLEAHGYNCSVCGMNFEQVYGPIGKDFIHVHHIKPIAQIGKEYEIDPVNDLVPVCPNCHAMLHKGKDGKVLTIEELKERLKK